MTIAKLLEYSRIQKIGKKPVVVLPLKIWRAIETRLEDLEMAASQSFRKKIAQARLEKKFYSAAQIKDSLGI